MLRYIDSTPIFTREAPSLTYSEHLTSQTLQATFFLSPRISRVGGRPPPIADPAKFSRAVPCLHSDTLSPPKFFLSPAREIPWKTFSSGNFFFVRRKIDPPKKHTSDRDNFSIGEGKCLPTRRPADCFLAPMSSLRYIVAFRFFSKSQRISPKENFFIGELFFCADRRPGLFFSQPPMFPLEYPIFRSPS